MELTAEHGKDKQLIMYPNCNISLKWGAQQGWVHLKPVKLQPGTHNASKTCKQVGNQIQETVKYFNEQYPGLSMNILHAGDKSPVQQGFFTNTVGYLLRALEVLGRLDNFYN